MLNIHTTYGKVFSQSLGQTLLDAAAKSCDCLPYSCKTGRCITCKCKVLSGQNVATVDELALTSEEKAQGFILSCVRSALTDMLIDVDYLVDQVITEIKTLPTRISSLEKLAPEVLCGKLRFAPKTPFPFLAGQNVDVIGPGGIRRSYSVANAPASDVGHSKCSRKSRGIPTIFSQRRGHQCQNHQLQP